MSQRGAFCINAATLGLTTTGSQSSSPRAAAANQKPGEAEQQLEQARKTLGNPGEDEKAGELKREQLQTVKNELEQSPRDLPDTEPPSIETLFATPSLRGGADASAVGSTASEDQTQFNASSEPTSTEHYRNQLKKLRGICGDAAMMNFELNSIFLKRLEEIDCMDQQSGGDSNVTPQLRLVTFQDWVDLLLHVNYIIFGNMSAMEVEAYEKIMNCFQSVRGEQQQALDENRKLRKDICAIIKLVQEAFHHNIWNTDEMCLETLTVNQLLGLQADQTRPESEAEKVTKCMRSLANEVAAKHDEVCHLQDQMCALDEVVQTARQKIILKDKCIAQLNQQLMELQDCLSSMTQGSNTKASLTEDYDVDFNHEDFTSCLFEGLNEKDQQASELLRMLNKELTEFIDLISKKDFQAMECRRKLLSCFFERINCDRADTLRKLENLRTQLRALDCNLDQLDAPIACSTQVTEDDFDIQLIDALRRRLWNINECNKELNSRCQRLEVQHRVELMEIRCLYEAERSINVKNCEALKQIADLLSKLRCSDLSYEEIYTDKSANNPFCVAIMEMYEKLNKLENSGEQEKQLLTNERLVCQIQSLQNALFDREQQIEQLRSTLNGYIDLNETNRLKDEISALKQKNTEQSQKVLEIASLLKAQEEERQKLCQNNEELMNNYEEQAKKLRRADREVQNLQDCMVQLEKRQDELKTERNLLREEVTALKEKDAKRSGRERALGDQLRSRQAELDKSRCLVRDMQNHLKQEERQHKETLDRLCQANEDIRQQMRAVACECKQMQLKLNLIPHPQLQTADERERAAATDYRIVPQVEGCADQIG
ncbi:ankycorbin isoform X2 [Drosophila novamexicana]|uniref:ankycorbin isoform X2 n=1 Tax=Drosophila novamexicana TaxID=47314 RepID=UPI0011E5E048|nr:ankycorbin isoform X2 [Drosophila novamexicana]